MDTTFVLAAAGALVMAAIVFALLVMATVGQQRVKIAALEQRIENWQGPMQSHAKELRDLREAGGEAMRRLNMLAILSGYIWDAPVPRWTNIEGKPVEK